jgi:hypothetical protein
MAESKIEWTESTWNPVTGCTKASPGCKNCYAERMAIRLQAMGQPNYRNGFKVSLPMLIYIDCMGLCVLQMLLYARVFFLFLLYSSFFLLFN